MNSILFSILVLLSIYCASFNAELTGEYQEQLNNAVDRHMKSADYMSIQLVKRENSDEPAINKAKSMTNMRGTSETARKVSSLASFALDFVKRQTSGAPMSITGSLYLNQSYCPFTTNVPKCNATYRYQSMDGTCNNLATPMMGAANTPYKRYMPNGYQDNYNAPRTVGASGKPLPNPRTVSLTISTRGNITTEVLNNNNFNLLIPFFGQFLTYKILFILYTWVKIYLSTFYFIKNKDTTLLVHQQSQTPKATKYHAVVHPQIRLALFPFKFRPTIHSSHFHACNSLARVQHFPT